MRQRDYNSGSFSPNGCGCLVLLILLTGVIVLVIPSFFMCNANKAKQSEAKQYVGSMNRAQQAKFVENGSLSNSVDALGLGIKTETTNYKYSIRATKKAAFQYAVSKQAQLKIYIGGVFVVPAKEVDPNAAKNEMTTLAIFCEAEDRPLIQLTPADKPAEPIYQNGKIACGKGTTELNK